MAFTSKSRLPTSFLLLCFVAVSWELTIVDFEVPRVILLGKDAELRCEYELEDEDLESSTVVKWFWSPASSVGNYSRVIYQRIAGRTPSVFQRLFGSSIAVKINDTIVLNNIQPRSSGVYECVVSSFTSQAERRETLTVFSEGTGPVIEIKEYEDSTPAYYKKKLLDIVCHVENVTPKPLLRVTINGKDVDTFGVVEEYENTGLYKANASLLLGADDVEGAGNEVRCEMSFSDSYVSLIPYAAVRPFILTS